MKMGFLDIFKRKNIQIQKFSPFETDLWRYAYFRGDQANVDIIRACIDRIATHASKMQLQCVYKVDGRDKADETSDVAKVLKKPNSYQTQPEFLKQVVSHLYLNNNAFIYPEYTDGKLTALYPINYRTMVLQRVEDRLYAKFTMRLTKTYVVPYEYLIHITRQNMTDDIFGDDNAIVLKPAIEIINAQNQSIVKNIANSSKIRGILKTAGITKERNIEKFKEQFVADNFNNGNQLIVLDTSSEYQPLNDNPYIVDESMMNVAQQKILNYFGISASILNNDFTATQYEAFYEGVLEPLSRELEEAFTYGLFTEREIGFGNKVKITMNRLNYQTYQTKVNIIKSISQLGVMTKNEIRELIGLDPVEDGDIYLVATNNYSVMDEITDKVTDNLQDETEQ